MTSRSDTAGLALQGRLSRRRAGTRRPARTGSTSATSVADRTTIAGVDIDVTRTGYTGDLGYELWIPVEGALAVWDRLFDVGADYGIRPAGIQALDICRLEAEPDPDRGGVHQRPARVRP